MRRALAFYKTDFKEFTDDEYVKIVKYVNDYNVEYSPDTVQKICIWDDGDYDLFMHWWSDVSRGEIETLHKRTVYNYDLYDFDKEPGDNNAALADDQTKERLIYELQKIID
jgi:hypothetical protein